MRGIVTTSSLKERIANLPSRVAEARGPVALMCKDPAINARVFAELSRDAIPDAIAVEVPRAVDQVERVILTIGARLGPAYAERLSDTLQTSGPSLASPLRLLDKALTERDGTLVLRGYEALYDIGGNDMELRRSLRTRTEELKEWLSRQRALLLSTSPFPVLRGESLSFDRAPSRLPDQTDSDADQLWSRMGHESANYELQLALQALNEDDPPGEHLTDPQGDPDAPHSVLRSLSSRTVRVLHALAVHGRPLPISVLRGVGFEASDNDVNIGAALGLWFPIGDQLLVHPNWRDWCVGSLSAPVRTNIHRELGQAFAASVRPEDPHSGRWGLSILEAHRHLVAAEDWPAALRYARFGSSLLIERARLTSLAAREKRDFGRASELYQRAVELQSRQPDADPASLRAYAKHYQHFNRAKADLELPEQTAVGYKESIDLWPQHALFWSRYVRVLFLLGRRAEAMQSLHEALNPDVAVPRHRDRLPTLVERTVDRLLDRPDHVLDAVEVWGAHRPSAGFGEEVARKLVLKVADGWSTTELSLTSGPGIAFHRPVKVHIYMISEEIWQAEVAEAQFHRRGANPLAALQALITAMRARCAELIAAFTHTLDARTRLEKQILLGCVDVVRSGLDARGPSAVTFLGTLRLEPDQTLALHTHGSRHLVFELPDELADDKVASDQLWIARVAAGAGGVPSGPILELKPAYQDKDAIVERWNLRLAHGG